MPRRLALLVLAASVALVAVLPAGSSAVAPNPNPWLTKRFLNIAHQGGEDEAPSSTLFALKSAVRERGADMLELDVNLTMDGQLAVIHDDTVSRTTNGPSSRPDSQVRDMTLAEIQALDAGYWFRPNSYSHDPSIPESEFIYRGVRTGAKPPPAGYTADDFKIPSLREVLDTFPGTPINIEIKMEKHQGPGAPGTGCTGDMPPYCDNSLESEDVAHALAAVLNEPTYASRTDIIVVSFSDPLIDVFHADAPNVALAPGLVDSALYVSGGVQPDPDVAAFQVPPSLEAVTNIPETLINDRKAHDAGYAVHVWPNDENGDTEAEYDRFLKLGVEGYMASKPGRLHAFLCAKEVPRPDGSDRCPNEPQKKKKCKKKGKGKKKKGKKCKKKKGKGKK